MANVTVVGYLRVAGSGDQIPLRTDSVAEGTETTITTDSNLTTVAQSVGTYKPGATIISAEITAPNGVGYCYILRQGLVLAWIVPNVAGVQSMEQPLCKPITLQPGDEVRCLPLTATARNASLLVYTAQGNSRIFVGTPSGAGTTSLLDLQDSNEIGETLQGQTIVKAALLTVDGGKVVSSGGAWIRNASGQLAGAIPATNPSACEAMVSDVQIPIALNFTADIVTNA
jgi:hypothetical protein